MKKLVTDEDIEKAFKYADYGKRSERDVVKYGLLKSATGYYNGHTTNCILKELGLVTVNQNLNKKGREYLYEAFKKEK